jgi:LPS O-antigen subunit length determinant protein (WzzB/FepE family)
MAKIRGWVEQLRLQTDGKLKGWVMTALVVLGALIIFLAIKLVAAGTWRVMVATLGLTLTAIGGYAAKAQVLGLRPFEESRLAKGQTHLWRQ